MIFGIGCDIVEIKRIENSYKKLGDIFLKKIFSQEEIQYCFTYSNPFPSFAARFAAKEATAKALGVGISGVFSWQDCFVICETNKKPNLNLSQKAHDHFGPLLTHISLSHTDEYAVATVILETPIV